jgi:hypothetical protein
LDAYVEYESETWKSAFSLEVRGSSISCEHCEVELNRSVLHVVEGFREELTDLEDISNALPRIQKLFHVVCEPLIAWMNAQVFCTDIFS